MWSEIEDYFDRYPAQKKVAKFLLRRGLQIGDNKRVRCGGMEVAHSQIAKELRIDRRAVDAAVDRILKNEKLRKVYQGLQSIAFLRDAAPSLGLGVIVISVEDASKPGIIGKIASKIAEHGIAIRQAIADDPYLTENPEFTVITEGEIEGKLLQDLKEVEGIKKITIY
jgi:hypothetical protein